MNASPSVDRQTSSERGGGALSGEGGRIAALILGLIADQATKWMARVNFSGLDGEPNYYKIKRVLGEWIQLRLVYNTGAAFGMKPQRYVPLLNPTVFYVLFSAVAIVVLGAYYRKLMRSDLWQKYGVALILSGAFGNLIDRLRFHKVTDFIDVGIPGLPTRWPTFNVADSCVCVGVALILLAPALTGKKTSAPAGSGRASADGPAVS